jgi:DNA (cytosine-5)-methyltransferase 1
MRIKLARRSDKQFVREPQAPYRHGAGSLGVGIQLATRVPRARRHSVARHLSAAGLFAGIGGIELGLRAAGHETQLLCEVDPAARAVLDVRFPWIKKHGDIRKLSAIGRSVELVAAGFPCQDLSQAGMTAGIRGASSGLISEVLRLLERRQVPWLLLENVPFMLRLRRGSGLDVIVSALEKLRYKWAYRVVDTLAFGLPQRRLRVYLLASRGEDPREVLFADEAAPHADPTSYRSVACGFYWTEGIRGLGWAVNAVPTLKGGSTVGVPSPPAVLMPDGRVVTPSIEDAERLQGFPAEWTRPAEGVAKRGLRWKLVGNAVSVPVARWVGYRLAYPGDILLRDVRPLPRGARWPLAGFNIGTGRFSNTLSTWPKAVRRNPLQTFLSPDAEPLSRRATAGFLGRTRRAKLRFPPGFLEAIEAHLRNMDSQG